MRIAILLAGVMLAAAMDVAHATTLLIGVDPETGESKFFIASGQGQVNKKSDAGEPGTTLNPNEQISLDNDTKSEDYDDYKNIADLDGLISNTSNAIIEAIIASKAAIDQENEAFIASLQSESSGQESNQQAIDRINQNLDNLVGNIVKNAISQGKVSEDEIKSMIDGINQQLDKKLDLDNTKPPLELSEQEKAKQAQIKLLEAERKKKQEAEKLKQEELKKQNEELQKKLRDQLEKQKAEKAKAAEAAKQKAAEEFAKKLTDAAAKEAFLAKQKAIEEQKQKALEEQKQKQEEAKKKAEEAAQKSAASTPPETSPDPQQMAGTEDTQSSTPSDADSTAVSGSGNAAGQPGDQAGQGGTAGGDGGAGGQAALGGQPESGGEQDGAGGQAALGGQPGSGAGQGGDGGGPAPQASGPTGDGAGGPPGIDPKQLALVGGSKLNQSQQQLAKNIDRLKEGMRIRTNTSDAPGAQGDLLGRIQAMIDFLRQLKEDEVNHMRAAYTPPSGGSSAGNQPGGAGGRYDPNAPLDTEWLRQLVNGGTLPPLTPLALAELLREVMTGQPGAGNAPLNGDRDADQAAEDKLLRDFVEQVIAVSAYPYIAAGDVSALPPTESLTGVMTATYNGRLSGAFGDGTTVGASMSLDVAFDDHAFMGDIVFDGGNGKANVTGGWNTGVNSVSGHFYATEPVYGGEATGSLGGKFYGPKGQELGGNWSMGMHSGVREGQSAGGHFVTKQ